MVQHARAAGYVGREISGYDHRVGTVLELQQQRDLSFLESAALSKEIEEAMMYRDMQVDIVQQMLRRLAAVKSL